MGYANRLCLEKALHPIYPRPWPNSGGRVPVSTEGTAQLPGRQWSPRTLRGRGGAGGAAPSSLPGCQALGDKQATAETQSAVRL